MAAQPRTQSYRRNGDIGPDVQVRRSARRRRTVSAYRDGNTVIVLIPDKFTQAEERDWVGRMVQRLETKRTRKFSSDKQLMNRAAELAKRYLANAVEPTSVRWVKNQRGRWGSCTPADRTIRLSHRLAEMPSWVIDYVLLHELVHLIVPGHGEKFWKLVDNYPSAQRARGYLEGVAAAASLNVDDCS
ncbi:MAG: M48 family metallopeptidase [Corynebacteriales bacterium]|nr:M48 family metallopeptidase [Mycobacteriales bacterium]